MANSVAAQNINRSSDRYLPVCAREKLSLPNLCEGSGFFHICLNDGWADKNCLQLRRGNFTERANAIQRAG